jgi:hypothetical protein
MALSEAQLHCSSAVSGMALAMPPTPALQCSSVLPCHTETPERQGHNYSSYDSNCLIPISSRPSLGKQRHCKVRWHCQAATTACYIYGIFRLRALQPGCILQSNGDAASDVAVCSSPGFGTHVRRGVQLQAALCA